jgi:hypothetical protein
VFCSLKICTNKFARPEVALVDHVADVKKRQTIALQPFEDKSFAAEQASPKGHN